MIQITLTETRLTKNPNTKNTYIVESNKVEPITEKQYNLYIDSVSFFRRLGGTESLQRAYTCYGYKVYKLTSISPDKQTKVIREFKFKDVPLPNNYDFKNLSLLGKYTNLNGKGKLTKEVIQMFKDYNRNEFNYNLPNEVSENSFNALHTELNKLNTL